MKRSGIRILLFIFILILVAYFIPLPVIYNPQNTSKAFIDRNNKLIKVTLTGDEKYRVYVPLSQIPQKIISSTLSYEDRYFYYHPGINPLAFTRSLVKSLLTGKLYGGSTISMQLARLRFNLKTRSLTGKLKQMLYAFLIELHYSKDEILEAYFNLAPYGGNVEGIGAASFLLLNKSPENLSVNDANWLSLIPQSPTLRNPLKKTGRNNLNNVSVNHPRLSGINSSIDSKDKALYQPIFSTKSGEQHAEHFIERIGRISPIGITKTTLDLEKQIIIEKIFSDYLAANSSSGIRNGSIILIDSTNMSVVSYLGSADYSSAAIDGYVNGLTAKRSPGSTIKPFIYALALDQGVITPDSLLKDTPINIASYIPDNFEKNFLGPVNATEALVRSRNIPAITLMNRLRSPTIYDFLKTNGISKLKTPEYYGLALALGGFEVSMEELAKLYGILINEGRSAELKFLANSPETAISSPLSPTAAYLTLEMLKTNPLPNETYTGNANNNYLPVPWKTGTSFSSKDAWSIGFAGKYILGVWIGNFDGSPNPNFVGRDIAGPLFFRIVDYLKSTEILSYPKPPAALNLATEEICALSGKKANKFCPHKKYGFIIPGVSPIQPCDVHRNIAVDQTESFQLCETDDSTKYKTYEFFDSDLFRLFELAGLKRRQPPPLSPECKSSTASRKNPNSIFIASPNSNSVYKIHGSGQTETTVEIPFYATTESNADKLYWFVDNRLIKVADSNENFTYKLKSGNYRLKVSDGIITSDEVKIRVEN